MKLIEALWKLDFSKYDGPDLEELESELQTNTCIGWSAEVNKHIREYPIAVWLCTDTEVGANAGFFDGEFAYLSTQSGRKSSIAYQFVSKEMALKIREFIMNMDENPLDRIKMLDPHTAEIDQYFIDRATHMFSSVYRSYNN